MGTGTIWTETDVTRGRLVPAHGPHARRHHDRGRPGRPAADPLARRRLAQPRRARLPPARLRADLPRRPARARRHARATTSTSTATPTQGDVRLFFFHYDCRVDGEPPPHRAQRPGRLLHRRRARELGRRALGRPRTRADRADGRARSAARSRARRALRPRPSVRAFADGRRLRLLRPRLRARADARAHAAHPAGPHAVPRRGHRASTRAAARGGAATCAPRRAVTPDDWFFDGHFKNDPCMPGTLMFEGCLQAMAFYLAALGYTLDRDGWRFEPVPERAVPMLRAAARSRPTSQQLVYEVFVDEVRAGPDPTRLRRPARAPSTASRPSTRGASACGSCPTGRSSTEPARELARHVPLRDSARRPSSRAGASSTASLRLRVAARLRLGPARRDAFGPMYAPLRRHAPRRAPARPAVPLHDPRHADRRRRSAACKPGAGVEVEYDVPPTPGTSTRTAPHDAVLRAARGRAPAVRLARLATSAARSRPTTDLLLPQPRRHRHAARARSSPTAGTLRTRVKLTSISHAGGHDHRGLRRRVLPRRASASTTMKTVFGFFPRRRSQNQVGLPATDEERARLARAERRPRSTSRARPARYCDGAPRLPGADAADARPRHRLLARRRRAGPRLRCAPRRTSTRPSGSSRRTSSRTRCSRARSASRRCCQLLQFCMLERGHGRRAWPTPRFEPLALGRAADAGSTAARSCRRTASITTELEITEVGDDERGRYAVADAWLWVDGKRIYAAREPRHADRRRRRARRARRRRDPDDESARSCGGHVARRSPSDLDGAGAADDVDGRSPRARGGAAHGRAVVALDDVQVLRWLPSRAARCGCAPRSPERRRACGDAARLARGRRSRGSRASSRSRAQACSSPPTRPRLPPWRPSTSTRPRRS